MITKATTKEEIIELFHPSLKAKIPSSLIDEIDQNILLFEMYHKGETFLAPHELTTTRIYDYVNMQITQVNHLDIIYKL